MTRHKGLWEPGADPPCHAWLVAVTYQECLPYIPTQPDSLDTADTGRTHPILRAGCRLPQVEATSLSVTQFSPQHCRPTGQVGEPTRGEKMVWHPIRTRPQLRSRGGRGPSSPSCCLGQSWWGWGEMKGRNKSPATTAPLTIDRSPAPPPDIMEPGEV